MIRKLVGLCVCAFAMANIASANSLQVSDTMGWREIVVPQQDGLLNEIGLVTNLANPTNHAYSTLWQLNAGKSPYGEYEEGYEWFIEWSTVNGWENEIMLINMYIFSEPEYWVGWTDVQDIIPKNDVSCPLGTTYLIGRPFEDASAYYQQVGDVNYGDSSNGTITVSVFGKDCYFGNPFPWPIKLKNITPIGYGDERSFALIIFSSEYSFFMSTSERGLAVWRSGHWYLYNGAESDLVCLDEITIQNEYLLSMSRLYGAGSMTLKFNRGF